MNILITGATGLVATQLTIWLLENTNHNLILLSRDSRKLASRYNDERIKCFTLDEIIPSNIQVDVCVHTAFARTAFGKDYAESLLYTSKLLNWIKTVNPSKFINISSQSVYGKIYQPMWTEQTPCAPDYNYAVAKFAAELIVNAYLQQTNINWTNIRLSSVCENARFVKFFVQNAIDKVDINVSAPNQMVSFIDVRDVAIGIGALIDSSKILKPVYNLGTGKSYTILDIANMVSRIGVEFGCGDTSINITGDADTSKIGMDNSLFCTEFNWCPKYSMEDSIKSLYEMLINPNGGGYPQAFKIVYNL